MKTTLSLLVLLSGLANYSHAGIVATFDFVPEPNPDPFFSTTGTATLDDSGLFTEFFSVTLTGLGIDGNYESTGTYVGTLIDNTLTVNSSLSTSTITSCTDFLSSGFCSFPDLFIVGGNAFSGNELVGVTFTFDEFFVSYDPIVFDLSPGGITQISGTLLDPFFMAPITLATTYITTSNARVPEPSPIFLTGVGLLIMSILRRKPKSI